MAVTATAAAVTAHVSYGTMITVNASRPETRGRWPSPPRRRRHRFGSPFGRGRTAARARIRSGQAPGFFRDSSVAGLRVCGVVAVAKVRPLYILPPAHPLTRLRATASHHLVHRRSRRRRRRHSHRRRRYSGVV